MITQVGSVKKGVYRAGAVASFGTLLAVAFVGSFVVLDLAVTWPNYSSLLILNRNYASAANGATSVLTSPAEAVLSILTLSVGILIAGAVMLKGKFGRTTPYLALATGILGILSTAGSILGDALASTIIITSLLTMIWVLFLGCRLNKLSAAESPVGPPK